MCYRPPVAHVQIRNVSPEAHRRLKELARRQGKSLSEYLRLEIERIAALPTWDEISAQINRRGRVKLDVDVAEIIREHRDAGA